MKSAILIVGEDYVLSETRALLLREWEVATAHPFDAPELIRKRSYDLLIVCQSVRDSSAHEVLTQAVQLHPTIQCLAISSAEGRGEKLPAATYVAKLNDPGGLRDAVAALLSSDERCAG